MVWQDYLLLLMLGGATLIYFIRQKRKPKRSAGPRTDDRLSRREQSAWRKLQIQGYRLDDIHPEIPIVMTADQHQKEFIWEGNFTVSKGGRVYLVRVVHGNGSLASIKMRRELLLDYLIFQPSGIFLYDDEKEKLQKLDFNFEPGVKAVKIKRILYRVCLFLLIVLGLIMLYKLAF